jgi:hypothetical protein
MSNFSDYDIRRRQELTLKLRDNTISKEEAQELRQILEREQQEAQRTKDFIALGAIFFLLGAVIAFLSESGKKTKKTKKKRFIFF